MFYRMLFTLLILSFGVTHAQSQTDSLKLVETTHPESFTEGEPDTVSFTFNKAIDTTASYPGTGPLGFWRIIPVDSAEIDTIWVSEDLKTINYRVEHKSRSDYTWLLESARAEDSTYLQRPYRLFYKLRSGEANRFKVSGNIIYAAFGKSQSDIGADNVQGQQYTYHIIALSTKKPTGEKSSVYVPDSIKYVQYYLGNNPYEINRITPGTYWPVLLRRVAYNEDNWVKHTEYLTAYDSSKTSGGTKPDSIVVKENDVKDIDLKVFYSNSIEDHDEPIDFFELKAYPNPFNNSTNIEITVAQPDRYSVAVYDITGRKVKTITKEVSLSRGTHRYHLDMAGLSTGIYNVIVQSSNGRFSKQISYIK